MSTAAEAGGETGRGVETAGLPALLLLLAALSGGPLLAPHLPSGPGSLLEPLSVCVGAVGLVLIWVLFAWPLCAQSRRPARIATSGVLIGLGSAPFLAGTAFSAGLPASVALRTALVVGVTIVVTGLYLAGPGRRRERDRLFGAGALLVLVAIPFGNFALNAFGGVEGGAGYGLSALLLARSFVLDPPGGDLVPFLCVSAAAAGLLIAIRGARGGAGILCLLLLAGTARAEVEVEPLLGDAYVPGRAIPFRVRGAEAGEEVWVRVPGSGRYGAVAGAEGAFLLLPLPRRVAGTEVSVGREGAWRPVDLGVRPVRPGLLWVVSLARVPDELGGAEGVHVTRGTVPAGFPEATVWLAVDAVFDPAAELDEARARLLGDLGVAVLRRGSRDAARLIRREKPPLRRVWEEGEDFSEKTKLKELCPLQPPVDRRRAAVIFGVLAGFAVAAAVLLRHGRALRWRPARLAVLLLALSAAATGASRVVAPEPAVVAEGSFTVSFERLETRILRLEAREDGFFERTCPQLPLVLERGPPAEVLRRGDGTYRLRVEVRRNEPRIVVWMDLRRGTRVGARQPPDLVLGPSGLSLSGEFPEAAVDFLRRHLRDRRGKPTLGGRAVTKLLDLATERLPLRRFGVVLPRSEPLTMVVVPLE